MERVVTGGLSLEGLERCAWWVGKGTAIPEALGEVGLLLEASLHGLLETGWLLLLVLCKPSLHRMLLGWRHGVVACGLRHHAVLLEPKTAILLWEACHLLLHRWHALSGVLAHHVWVVACELRL